MNKPTEKAFHWIYQLLHKYQIPFQVTGGLAAHAYGATRPIEDIDLDIPDDKFSILAKETKPYICFGPAFYQDDAWELMLMTLDYHGQMIDFSGVSQVKIFNHQTRLWESLHTDLSHAEMKVIFGINVPVIAKSELIYYKKALSRPVDLIDLEQITQ